VVQFTQLLVFRPPLLDVRKKRFKWDGRDRLFRWSVPSREIFEVATATTIRLKTRALENFLRDIIVSVATSRIYPHHRTATVPFAIF
jgi:hypothetical protein